MKIARQRVSATKSGNGLQKTLQTISIWHYLLFILFFYFSVVLVVIEEKSPEIRDFPGLMPCNGIATEGATGYHFQNGSSICSVTSTKPSIVFSDGLHKSVAEFSRSQPFCLPYSGNILGFWISCRMDFIRRLAALISRFRLPIFVWIPHFSICRMAALSVPRFRQGHKPCGSWEAISHVRPLPS